jgi:hypothetical protein
MSGGFFVSMYFLFRLARVEDCAALDFPFVWESKFELRRRAEILRRCIFVCMAFFRWTAGYGCQAGRLLRNGSL